MEEDDDKTCTGCSSHVVEPYIQCIQCLPDLVFLCLRCFARGVENDQHKSEHPYTFIKNDFPLYEKRWKAVEEMKLLHAIDEYGYGNWKEISADVKSKTSTECEQHYNKHYVEQPIEPLPAFNEPEISLFPSPIVFKLSEDPPRPPEGSTLYNDMGGYSASRGDFRVEYDNYSEFGISNINVLNQVDEDTQCDDEDELSKDLVCAAADIYNSSLKERERRKQIIRDYGLINITKLHYTNKRYDKTIKPWIDSLRVFCKLFNPVEYDIFLEGLHYEQELKSDIRCLQKYRYNGLTRIRNIRLFETMRKRREITRSRRHFFSDLIHHVQDEDACKNWLQKQAGSSSKSNYLPLPNPPRKTPAPLEIMSYPGYDKLTSSEKEMCAAVRLIPEAFMEFKKTLMRECQKLGGIRLAQARGLIKIDVNKTRKLYDFLISEGCINK